MNIGNLIKEGLYRKRMTQSQLARKIGKPRQIINDWIQNRKMPEFESLKKIMIELDLVTDIFPGYEKVEKEDITPVSSTSRNLRPVSCSTKFSQRGVFLLDNVL